ncbi:phage integrase N-terminal SAM-like domain-containing protein [Trichocoleus sp. FACHB-90]|uniref:phage integrase N-terminal SAM-like domain-containing protein n=1 Tax=Cyanophyceae TaxID=3028117 RepID=UPI001683C87D|nr:phage integrase N-terminal SAM-like domain-containing protein [Trichocoleus sp. FACHB-90]MBD1929498.1 phage integrase N-terminal SAM-like domain-containing protein [Trichocoleus sp. FACHB-90]
MEQRPKKLLEQVQDVIRLKHYSYQTEKTYIYWIRRYILFHNKRHPKDMESKEIEEFLTHLAVNENVAASTQNQALHAVSFLYKEVLKQDLDLKVDAVRAKKSNYLPTVLTKDEVLAILQKLSGVYQLLIKLLYGTGLRCGNNPEFRASDS